jgi:hypothetical protein
VSPWCDPFSETCAIGRNPLMGLAIAQYLWLRIGEMAQKRFSAET